MPTYPMNESVLQASSPHSRALRELVTGARQFELNDVTVGKCVGTYDIMETHKGSYKGNKVMVKVIRGDLIRTAVTVFLSGIPEISLLPRRS